MVSENMASWVWLTPLIGAKIVGIFVLDPVSWSFTGGWKEAAIEVIGFRTLVRYIYSIGTEEWNY